MSGSSINMSSGATNALQNSSRPEDDSRNQLNEMTLMFTYSLNNPFNCEIIVGNYAFSLHSKVVSKHSKVLARIVEESREEKSTMTYTIADEEPANVARAIIFMYTSGYPDNDTISCTEEPADVKKLLNAGRKTTTETTPRPRSHDVETSTAKLLPRALCMYKIARKLEMEELQTFSLGMLGQDIAWNPQLFWTMLESVESLSNDSDPLARFASEMAKKHLLKLCGDIKFKNLTKTEPAFAYILICELAKNSGANQQTQTPAPPPPKPTVLFPAARLSTPASPVKIEQSSVKFGQGMFNASLGTATGFTFGGTTFGSTPGVKSSTFQADPAKFPRRLSSSPATSDDLGPEANGKRQKIGDGSHQKLNGNGSG